jgi:hypothetical protein
MLCETSYLHHINDLGGEAALDEGSQTAYRSANEAGPRS